MSRLSRQVAKELLKVTPYIHGQFTNASASSARKLADPVKKTNSMTVFDTTSEQLEAAVQSAKEVIAQPHQYHHWQSNPSFRRDCLLALAQKLETHSRDMAEIESLQTGKPLLDSILEVHDVVECFRFFAGYCDKLYGQTQQLYYEHQRVQQQQVHAYTTFEPIGIVSLITSFNYPLLLTGWKLAPALAAGNCAIVKPAPQTPLSTLALAELGTNILPPGVLNIVPGGASVGSALIERTDKTSFTGSTHVGQHIMSQAAQKLLPLTLECGGKNAAIVCEDADISLAAEHVATGAFSNAGQNCCAISKVYVQESVYPLFLNKLMETMNSWRATLDIINNNNSNYYDNYSSCIGDNGNASVEQGGWMKKKNDIYKLYGPLIDDNQYTRVLRYINNANTTHTATKTFTAYMSEETAQSGFFVPPTIFSNVCDDDVLATEEIFGPVLSILKPFKTVDEAIQRVNKSRYGLACGLFTNNVGQAHRTASLIKTGYVWINTYNLMPPSLPFGGRGMSGFGKDLGKTSLKEFSFEKTVLVNL